MKRILLLALLFTSGIASAQRCKTPVSEAVFQQNFNQIAVLRGDDGKQPRAEQFVTANCVSSQQLKTMAQLFTSDSVRLIVCEKAYPKVTDTANFFTVYDAFASFSYALRLYDFVQHYKPATGPAQSTPRPSSPPVITPTTTTTTTTTTLVTRPAGLSFPLWVYPDTVRATASKDCAGPVIAEQQFQSLANNAFVQPTEEAKVVAIENAFTANCMSMAQQMKMASLLQNEDNRMRVMKAGFARVYDQEHYPSATTMFTAGTKKDEWNNYCAAYLTPPCAVSEQDFKPLLAQIAAKSFDDDQVQLVEMMIVNRCFNTAQLKAIADEMTFDEGKMKVFKMCYARCPDKQNYYQLTEKLTFTGNKDELRRFINAGGK